MNQVMLSRLEQSIMELPEEERRRLISRVTAKMQRSWTDDREFETILAEMAADGEIQTELREIALDFQNTELDGLSE